MSHEYIILCFGKVVQLAFKKSNSEAVKIIIGSHVKIALIFKK